MVRKIRDLRILREERSVAETGAPVLLVSQFTLYGDARKGRRPTWQAAAPGEVAEPLFEAVCTALEGLSTPVQRGRFGADMAVALVNDGPVTLTGTWRRRVSSVGGSRRGEHPLRPGRAHRRPLRALHPRGSGPARRFHPIAGTSPAPGADRFPASAHLRQREGRPAHPPACSSRPTTGARRQASATGPHPRRTVSCRSTASRQSSLQIGPLIGGELMAEAAVELHQQALFHVAHVPEAAPTPVVEATLPLPPRQPVRPLHPGEVAMLEQRVGAGRDVVEQVGEEPAAGQALGQDQRLVEPSRCRDPLLAHVGEYGHCPGLASGHPPPRRDLERCILEAEPGRRPVPHHPFVEVPQPYDPHARGWTDASALGMPTRISGSVRLRTPCASSADSPTSAAGQAKSTAAIRCCSCVGTPVWSTYTPGGKRATRCVAASARSGCRSRPRRALGRAITPSCSRRRCCIGSAWIDPGDRGAGGSPAVDRPPIARPCARGGCATGVRHNPRLTPPGSGAPVRHKPIPDPR